MTRLYRLALRLLSPDTRDRHGAQMAAVFAALVHDARARGGWLPAARVTAAEFYGLLWFAFQDRRAARRCASRVDHALAWSAPSSRRPLVLGSLVQDVRYALRMLGRTPGFTIVCVATMAAAIGANSAIFTVVQAVLLRPLPYASPDRLVVAGHRQDAGDGVNSTSPGNFYDWQASASDFEAMAAWTTFSTNIMGPTLAERVTGTLSAGSIFEVLGTRALFGRTFTADEERPGAPPVVVLGYDLWRRLYGEDRSVIGRGITLGATTFTIIGVTPPDFAFPNAESQYWIPARFTEEARNGRDQYFLLVAGRLKPHVRPERAQAQLDTVLDRIRRDYPQETEAARATVRPMQDLFVGGVRTRLLVLLGAVAFVLLIASANLGNLLLGRAAMRRQEMALRQALGARPLRLFRQLLTESVVLASLGGLTGLLLAALLLEWLLVLLPPDLPRAREIRLDLGVLGFTVLASAGSGLIFGIFPALHLCRRASASALNEGARGTGATGWVRGTLVVCEVALAMALVAGASLLIRSFVNLLDVKPGFAASQLLTFRVGIAPAAYPEAAARELFFRTLAERLWALPGVTGVAMTTNLPVTGRGTSAWFNVIDKPLPPNRTPPAVPYRIVAADALQVLGVPLLRGRYLTEDDGPSGARGIVISESVARQFWPNDDPIGRAIYMGTPDNRIFDEGTVVGVVADVKQIALDEGTPAAVYIPHARVPSMPAFAFALRTPLDPAALVPQVRDIVRQMDPRAPVFEVRTMDEVLAQSRGPARASTVLLGLFAALALLLAVLGVFGVVSYAVTQQTRELGIRMALGADVRHVVRFVVRQGLTPVAAGIVLGAVAAFALARSLDSLVFGVSTRDPGALAASVAVLALTGAVACYLPARRAARVDPVRVLRSD